MSDKIIEKKRYDNRALLNLKKYKSKILKNSFQPSYLKTPVNYYFNFLKKLQKKNY